MKNIKKKETLSGLKTFNDLQFDLMVLHDLNYDLVGFFCRRHIEVFNKMSMDLTTAKKKKLNVFFID